MSNKNKDKKPEELQELERLIEQEKHSNLQLTIMNQKLTEVSIIVKKQLQLIQKESHTQHQQINHKIQSLELTNQSLLERLNQIRQEREEFQIQNGCLKYKLQKLQKSFDQYKYTKQKQSEDYKKYVTSQLIKYQTIVNDYHGAINERMNYIANNQELQKKIQAQGVSFKKIVADKDRDKIQAIDELKKEMFQKSRQMRTNLLNMRRQQMETNTRLTVLQNQQLLQELEYQSKNTSKIIKKNLQLQNKVKQLTTQLQIQKQIQKELATRTTISKKIVKSLNQKNNKLQSQIKRQSNVNVNTRPSQNQSILKKQMSTQKMTLQYKKVLNLLQVQLLNYQKQIQVLQKQKMHFKTLYQTFQPQYQFYLNSQNDLRILMIRFYQTLLEGNITEEENQTVYDISRLKNTHVSLWTKSDMQITIKMLLTFLKPNFIMKNMKTSYLKGKQQINACNININMNMNMREMLPQIKKITQKQAEKKLKSKSLSDNQFRKLMKNSLSKSKGTFQNANTKICEKSKLKRDLSLHESTITPLISMQNNLKKQKTRSQHNLGGSLIGQQILQSQDLKENKISSKNLSKPYRQWGEKIKLLKEIPQNSIINVRSSNKIQKKSKLLTSHVKFHQSSCISQKKLK